MQPGNWLLLHGHNGMSKVECLEKFTKRTGHDSFLLTA